MQISVDQEVAGNTCICCAEIEGYAVRFGIPIGTPTVFLAGKSFRSDVEPRIRPGVGLPEVKDVETNALLRRHISIDADIRTFPDATPGFCMLPEHGIIPKTYLGLQF